MQKFFKNPGAKIPSNLLLFSGGILLLLF